MKSGVVAKLFATLLLYWRTGDYWQKQLIVLGALATTFVIVALLCYLGAGDHLDPLKYATALILINTTLFLVVFRQIPTIGDAMLLSLVVVSLITAVYYLVFYLGSGV